MRGIKAHFPLRSFCLFRINLFENLNQLFCRVDGDEGWKQDVDSLEETLTSLGLEVGFNPKCTAEIVGQRQKFSEIFFLFLLLHGAQLSPVTTPSRSGQPGGECWRSGAASRRRPGAAPGSCPAAAQGGGRSSGSAGTTGGSRRTGASRRSVAYHQ